MKDFISHFLEKEKSMTLNELEYTYNNLKNYIDNPEIYCKIQIEIFPPRNNSKLKSYSIELKGEFLNYDIVHKNFEVFFQHTKNIEECFEDFKKLKVIIYFMGERYKFTITKNNSLISIDRNTKYYPFSDKNVLSHIRLKLIF